jgi:hypothetical protein
LRAYFGLDDHNISEETQTRGRETSRRPRLELDEFFETLGQQDRTGFSADPFTSLARAFGDMGDGSSRSMVIDNLVETLLNEAGSGKKVHGVPDGFLDTLERVSKKKLKESDSCVICGMRFLDGEFFFFWWWWGMEINDASYRSVSACGEVALSYVGFCLFSPCPFCLIWLLVDLFDFIWINTWSLMCSFSFVMQCTYF